PDRDDPGRNPGDQPRRHLQIYFERLEIAAVDAHHCGAGVERALELLLRANFHDRLETEEFRARHHARQLLRWERTCDQENCRRLLPASVDELRAVDVKILAQYRQRGGPADRHHVLGRTAEVRW